VSNLRRKRVENRGLRYCAECRRKYRIRTSDGMIQKHSSKDVTSECPGSSMPPAEEDSRAPAGSMSSEDIKALTGIPDWRLRRWEKNGLIVAHPRGPAGNDSYIFDDREVEVAIVMNRLSNAGIVSPPLAASIARKHVDEVDILAAMGHTGDSIATEHTIGDGLVLTIH
jgi:hypothetical protein